jgi:hypothetical protein
MFSAFPFLATEAPLRRGKRSTNMTFVMFSITQGDLSNWLKLLDALIYACKLPIWM